MNQCKCGVKWDPAVQAHRYCNIGSSTRESLALNDAPFIVDIERLNTENRHLRAALQEISESAECPELPGMARVALATARS